MGDSPSLTSLSFPNFITCNGDFVIANNSALLNVSGFPLLQTTLYVNMTGAFTTVALPSLNNVTGDVHIHSSFNDFQCPIPQAESVVVNQGYSFVCASISSSASASSANTGQNSGNTAGGIVGGIFLLILIGIIWVSCGKKHTHRRYREEHHPTPVDHGNRILGESVNQMDSGMFKAMNGLADSTRIR